MLDIKTIRENPKESELKLKTKDPSVSVSQVISLDEEIRELKLNVEKIKNLRNQSAKQIGEKKRKGEDVSALLQEIEGAKKENLILDEKLNVLQKRFNHELSLLPNIPMDGIKESLDPKENVCTKTFGTKTTFSFPHKNHLELSENLNLFDFKRGAKIGGSGWPIYTRMGARLEWALINFMLEIHVENGFIQWIPPLVAKPEIMLAAGQLPKFEEQLYKLKDKDHDLYLIPTAEAVLNGIHYDEILKKEELPLKYVAYTPCFRREAGAAGANERGLIRTHQFNKVEMFCITKPDESAEIFDQMVKSAETILEKLELHYRTMLLVTGDMSFAAAKTVDLEVFLPGQDRYYEVSSVSNCTDYQARRSKMRFKEGQEKPQFVHTLNGSGLATSRLMVALLENNQQKDGSIRIPKVLQKYMGGLEILTPPQIVC